MSPHIYSERLLSLCGQNDAPELVLWHGWGGSSDIWRPSLSYWRRYYNVTLFDYPGFGRSSYVRCADSASALRLLLPYLPERAIHIGFSMGGMLAAQLAQQFPQRVQAVVTLASNLCFVAQPDWPEAMDADNFARFCQAVASQPQRTLKKFIALQTKGCEHEHALLKQLHYYGWPLPDNVPALTSALAMLATIDNRPYFRRPSAPTLALFGAADSIVPVGAAQRLHTISCAQVVVIDGASHLLFISHAQQCWRSVATFLAAQGLAPKPSQPPMVLDKRQIARSFSRAANSYNQVADLQRHTGQQLLTLATAQPPLSAQQTGGIVDLGCGTGLFLAPLQQLYPYNPLFAIDIAVGMLQQSRQNSSIAKLPLLCADATNMPLASASVAVIFANLTVQWCTNVNALFAEISRVLQPGGYCVFSTLGPRSLFELRSAWRRIDDRVHVNTFITEQTLLTALQSGRSGLQRQYWREEMITQHYGELDTLLNQFRQLGSHNINRGRPLGLMGKRRMQAFRTAYEQQRNSDGLLPVTYQVWYGVLRK